MGIFRRNQIDLSDEGLALAAEDSNVIKEAAADEGQTNIRDHSSAVNSLAAAGGLSTEDDLPAQETGQELEEQQPFPQSKRPKGRRCGRKQQHQ